MRKLFSDVTNNLETVYYEKNKRYGNSFKDLYDELGIISAVTQILHKAARLKYLGKYTNDKSEFKDTLMDMANYCIMTLMEIEDE